MNPEIKNSFAVKNGRKMLGRASLACLFGLPLACGNYDDLGSDRETHDSVEQAISGGTQVTGVENVETIFGPAVRMGANCSGVKIGRFKFLTAAHCFSDTSTTSVKITNSVDGTLPATAFTITKSQRHPSHKLGSDRLGEFVENGLYDLSIIEIREETPSIPIAKVSPLTVPVGSSGYVSVGYGCNTSTPNLAGKKQKANFSAVLGADVAHVHYISEGSAPALCPGDSGGPLFRLVNGEMQVTGINAGTAIFTRIENTAPWIANPVVNDFTNNSVGSFMNLASASASAFPRANCVAMFGTGTGTFDVRLDQCDGQSNLYNGRHSVTWAPTAGNTGAGFQKIINFGNGSCLGVDGASTADANVSAIPCAASTAALATRQSQAWKFVDMGQAAGTSVGTPAIRAFNIINERSGKCLSTTGSTAEAVGSDVRQSTCDSTRRDQKWVFTR